MYFHVPVALLSFFGVMSSCQAQIFPFSNLRAFFDQKAKNGPGGQGFFKNYPVLTAAESEIKTQHVLPPTTATPSTTSRRPSLLYPHFDPEEGFREFRRPDPLPTSRSPAPLPRHKLKARLPVETHSYPGYYQDGSSNITDPKKRSPLHIPLNIAYETPPLVNSSGSSIPPAFFLTPPIPPRLSTLGTSDSAPSASSPSESGIFKTASTKTLLPPVPSFFLRAPPPPSDLNFVPFKDDSNIIPIKIKSPQSVSLDLSDVAKAAVSLSQNPAIVKESHKYPKKASEVASSSVIRVSAIPLNHKPAAQQFSALNVNKNNLSNHKPDNSSVYEEKQTVGLKNHKTDKSKPNLSNHKLQKHKGDLSNHKLETNSETPVVDSSPTEAAALGHYGNFHGNAYRIPPKNHRFPSSAQATDGHMHKYREPPHQKLQPAHKTHKPPEARQRPKHPNHQNYPNHVNHFNHPNHHSDHVVEESMDSHRYRKQQHPAHHLEQEIAASGLHSGSLHGGPPSTDGDRVEFQMHGLQGPKSYKFGYDTGKGHNRQFRYEERDPHGNVKGHYGYVNEEGKLQVVNYQADPEHGFSADVSKLHL